MENYCLVQVQLPQVYWLQKLHATIVSEDLEIFDFRQLLVAKILKVFDGRDALHEVFIIDSGAIGVEPLPFLLLGDYFFFFLDAGSFKESNVGIAFDEVEGFVIRAHFGDAVGVLDHDYVLEFLLFGAGEELVEEGLL